MDIVASLGVLYVTVPDVTGRPRDAAETAISATGLTLGEILEANIDLYPSGQIFLQSPSPGETAIHDAPMDLSVYIGGWTGVDETPHPWRRWSRMNSRG